MATFKDLDAKMDAIKNAKEANVGCPVTQAQLDALDAKAAAILADEVLEGESIPGMPTTPIVANSTTVPASIDLSWVAGDNATSYNVKRSTVSGQEVTIASVTAPTTKFEDKAISAATTYFYVVSAVNATGESANSAEVSVTTA